MGGTCKCIVLGDVERGSFDFSRSGRDSGCPRWWLVGEDGTGSDGSPADLPTGLFGAGAVGFGGGTALQPFGGGAFGGVGGSAPPPPGYPGATAAFGGVGRQEGEGTDDEDRKGDFPDAHMLDYDAPVVLEAADGYAVRSFRPPMPPPGCPGLIDRPSPEPTRPPPTGTSSSPVTTVTANPSALLPKAGSTAAGPGGSRPFGDGGYGLPPATASLSTPSGAVGEGAGGAGHPFFAPRQEWEQERHT